MEQKLVIFGITTTLFVVCVGLCCTHCCVSATGVIALSGPLLWSIVLALVSGNVATRIKVAVFAEGFIIMGLLFGRVVDGGLLLLDFECDCYQLTATLKMSITELNI